MGLSAICKREDPRDAFISNLYKSIEDLPIGSKIGTSSLRRKCQLKSIRPDLNICDLRGNVETRIQKLDKGLYDAIILAVSGLKRLNLHHRIKQILSIELMLPAIGQGAIGVECKLNNIDIINLLNMINHNETSFCVKAERSMNAYLNGNCQMPIASLAMLKKNKLFIRGLVGSINGKYIIKSEYIGDKENYLHIGKTLAQNLIKNGAKNILANYL